MTKWTPDMLATDLEKDMYAALQSVWDDWEISAETWHDSSVGPATVSGEPIELPADPETVECVRAVMARARGEADG